MVGFLFFSHFLEQKAVFKIKDFSSVHSDVISVDSKFAAGISGKRLKVIRLTTGEEDLYIGLPKELEAVSHNLRTTYVSAASGSVFGLQLMGDGKSFSCLVNVLSNSLTILSQSTSDKPGFVGVSSDKAFVVRYDPKASKVLLETVSQSTLKALSSVSFSEFSIEEKGFAEQLWVLEDSKIIVLFEDDSLSLISGGKVSWIREESLADIVDAVFVECPPHSLFFASLEHGDSDLQFPGFFARLSTQSAELAAFFADSSKSLISSLPQLLNGNKLVEFAQSPFKLEREKLGRNKVFIALSSRGKVVAIRVDNSQIMWGKFLGASGFRPSPAKLYLTKQKATGGAHPEISIFTSLMQKSKLWRLDASSGNVQSSQKFDFGIDFASPLPIVDEHHRSLLFLLNSHGKAMFDSPLKNSSQILQEVCLPIVDYEKGIVKGLAFEGGVTTERWQLNFGVTNEQISSVSFHDPAEVVQEHWRSAGGAETQVKEKYLNKNLLAIATTTTSVPDSQTVISPSRSGSWVVIYLIDSVTGSVLLRVANRDGEGPVHLTLTENTVIFHYLNTRERRFEVSVIELFVNPAHPSVPHHAQHTYGFSSGIRSLKVTTTRRGISPKMVLFGLTSNRVLGLPQQFLDTRRALAARKPTPEEQASGILPYRSYLPFSTQSMISYTNSIHRIRDIIVTDTEMESTSLILCYGLDLFFTQVSPSQSFDLLNEDFNLPFLIATVTLVAVGVVVSHYLSQKKRLSLDWQ
jgi:hypothetical protein